MDNPKISEETREKLEEATVSVFMEQYAKALDVAMNQKMEECADDVFPPELEKRCRALIQQEYAKERNRKRRKNALRALRSAAVVAIALLSLCSVLFMTVEAFRVPVINFFTEHTNSYWLLSEKPNIDKIEETFNEENPLDGIIPDDFSLIALSGTVEEGNLVAKYSNGSKATITFFVDTSLGKLQIDAENAAVSESGVAGHDASIYVEGDSVRLAWLDGNVSRAFSIYATNVSQDAVESFAEAVATYFD